MMDYKWPVPNMRALVKARPDGSVALTEMGTQNKLYNPTHGLQRITLSSGRRGIFVSLPSFERGGGDLCGYLAVEGEQIVFQRFDDGEVIIFGP